MEYEHKKITSLAFTIVHILDYKKLYQNGFLNSLGCLKIVQRLPPSNVFNLPRSSILKSNCLTEHVLQVAWLTIQR